MSRFKVGNEVKVIGINSTSNAKIKIGDTRVVTDICSSGVELDSIEFGWVHDYDVELVNPKWTIYNNTLPWKELSDEQKGKMLLAAHGKVLFKIGKSGVILDSVGFSTSHTVYQAVETVKPEPTMAELFDADADSFDFRRSKDFPEYMIDKGWVKKC
jgi:hypothetical protein